MPFSMDGEYVKANVGIKNTTNMIIIDVSNCLGILVTLFFFLAETFPETFSALQQPLFS
jgi:hypothetical protein